MRLINEMSYKNLKDPRSLLEEELSSLKNLIPFDAAQNLVVCWKPNSGSSVFGEVKGNTILLYDSTFKDAVATLRHEYLDFFLSKKLITPLMALINAFIDLKTKEVYMQKEGIVDCLIKFLPSTADVENQHENYRLS